MLCNFYIRCFQVVCGTQNGVLLIWSWGVCGDCSDRFPGFPPDISALEVVDEDTVVMGGCDGLLYVAHLQPNAIMGKLGDNSNSLLPVERLAFSGDREWLGWVSHDEKIRFLDAASLRLDNCGNDDNSDGSSEECSSREDEEEESFEEDGSLSESSSEEQDEHEKNTTSTTKRQRRIKSDDNDDSDDNDGDSENPYSSSVKRHNNVKKRMSNAEQFYSDL